jgi:hypothetical protein
MYMIDDDKRSPMPQDDVPTPLACASGRHLTHALANEALE